MLEMEMKFAVQDFHNLEAKLQAWGITPDATVDEADYYFNAPDRDFKLTDEAFRLRCVGDANRITYKGPKQKGPVKTRKELEVAIESGTEAAERFRQVLIHLGYRPNTVVRKTRTSYSLNRSGFDLQICLDAVEGIGHFAEVEIVTDEAHQSEAETLLKAVATELDLTALEPRSYLRMVLEANGQE